MFGIQTELSFPSMHTHRKCHEKVTLALNRQLISYTAFCVFIIVLQIKLIQAKEKKMQKQNIEE